MCFRLVVSILILMKTGWDISLVKDVTCWMTIKLHILIKYYKGSFMYKEYILTKDSQYMLGTKELCITI